MVPKQVVVKVEGMSCDKCARSVREALERTEGVFSAVVSLDEAEATVTFDASVIPESVLLSTVSDAGYDGELMHGQPLRHYR